MRFCFFFALFLAVFSLASPVFATSCDEADHETAEFWGNYYSPQEAYEFGLYIQDLILDKDMNGLFELIDGELEYGPKRAFALSQPFDKVFGEEWSEQVVSEEPSCSPVGWRGFMLGHGMIWYDNVDGDWKIVSINDIG